MNLKDTLNEALKGKIKRFKGTQKKEECSYFPKNRIELLFIIRDRVKEDPLCDLNDVWVGEITDMTSLFEGSAFDGDISRWDVSNVTHIGAMFFRSDFDGDISDWNVGKVRYMNNMFEGSVFKGDISSWNVSNVKEMNYMFWGSKFDGDISSWKVSKNTEMIDMFAACPLEKNPPIWYR